MEQAFRALARGRGAEPAEVGPSVGKKCLVRVTAVTKRGAECQTTTEPIRKGKIVGTPGWLSVGTVCKVKIDSVNAAGEFQASKPEAVA